MYTRKDFLGELASNYGIRSIQQTLQSTLTDYLAVEKPAALRLLEIQPFIALLELNDFIRADKETYYKPHKGYPSPRSLYPVQLFLALGDHAYVSKSATENKLLYFRNENLQASKGDLVLEFEDKYPSYYEHIKKTLLILEIGHLLYNIFYVAQILGHKYKLHGLSTHFYLERLDSMEKRIDEDEILAFKTRSMVRNSGPYLYSITSPQPEYIRNVKELAAELKRGLEEAKQYFELSEGGIKTITYCNMGAGNFAPLEEQDLPMISYRKMNRIYPHVNFYGVSFFTFFLIEHRKLTDERATAYLAAVGYIAQLICLKYSSPLQFCRPIKSFNMDEVEALFEIDSRVYTSFYFLLSGSKSGRG